MISTLVASNITTQWKLIFLYIELEICVCVYACGCKLTLCVGTYICMFEILHIQVGVYVSVH